jgi:hypothetical protein
MAAAAARQAGKGLDRGARTAEMVDECAKRPRPRYYGASATSFLK